MAVVTTLLVSDDPALIAQVTYLHDARDQMRLTVCGRVDKACVVAARDNFDLILIHLTGDITPSDRDRILRARTSPRPATAAFVGAAANCRDGTDGAVTDLMVRPDPDDLARLLDAVSRCPGASRRAAADPASRILGDLAPVLFAPSESAGQLRRLERVIGQDTTILLTGETGTGKSLLARRIHELSPRHNEPRLIIDCGALSDSLIESEMFGHVRGAFTGADRDRPGKFAAAGRGTLVLDEINSLRPPMQCKLLRAVEDRVFEPVGSNASQPLRARLIALSNTPLDREVLAGRFRADLYYRLNVVRFHLPPLRERRPAIPALAAGFLSEYGQAAGREVTLAPDAEAALCAYDWPGNVRELRNAIESAVALSAGSIIHASDLPRDLTVGRELRPTVGSLAPCRDFPIGGKGVRESTEVHRIMVALEKNHNNRQRTAAELGISRVSLYKKLHKYGLFERP